eukprot:COSAG05_NODE_5387_length_1190_cov_5.817688_1_plen_107_part_00
MIPFLMDAPSYTHVLIALRVQLLRTFVMTCMIDIYLQNPCFLCAHVFRIVICALTCAALSAILENRSSEWGVSAWHWYFSAALPKALLPAAMLLIPIGWAHNSPQI